MRLSARNQLAGRVTKVTDGAVNGIVEIAVDEVIIKASITMEAIAELGLATDREAIAVVKASNVLVAAGGQPLANLSARNQLVGSVQSVTKGAVNAHVVIELPGGAAVTASITNEAVDELGLAVGQPAVAIVKSTDVLVAVS